MEKTNLFDKKFVRFMWEDELEGKVGFFSNYCSIIREVVNEGCSHIEDFYGVCSHSNSDQYPFNMNEMKNYQFFYCDPNYSCKKAYMEGKQIQISGEGEIWVDWVDDRTPDWDSNFQFRIKPTKFIVYSDCPSHYFINSEDETIDNKWEKMFEGTEKECEEWLQNRLEEDNTFESANLYKKYCANCKYSSLDGRCYPCNDCYEGSRVDNEIYIPYENTDEFIKDYCDRFKVATLNHRLPTIWIKSKETSECCLIIKYSKDKVYTDMWIDLKTLLDEFTFVDNTVIGKVEE